MGQSISKDDTELYYKKRDVNSQNTSELSNKSRRYTLHSPSNLNLNNLNNNIDNNNNNHFNNNSSNNNNNNNLSSTNTTTTTTTSNNNNIKSNKRQSRKLLKDSNSNINGIHSTLLEGETITENSLTNSTLSVSSISSSTTANTNIQFTPSTTPPESPHYSSTNSSDITIVQKSLNNINKSTQQQQQQQQTLPYFVRTRSKSLNLSSTTVSTLNNKEAIKPLSNSINNINTQKIDIKNTNKIEGRKSRSTNALFKSLTSSLTRKGKKDKLSNSKDNNSGISGVPSHIVVKEESNDSSPLKTTASPTLIIQEQANTQELVNEQNIISFELEDNNNNQVLKEREENQGQKEVEEENYSITEEQQQQEQEEQEDYYYYSNNTTPSPTVPKKPPPPLPPKNYKTRTDSNNSITMISNSRNNSNSSPIGLIRKFSNLCLVPPNEPIYPNGTNGSGIGMNNKYIGGRNGSNYSSISSNTTTTTCDNNQRNSVELKMIQDTYKYILLDKLGSGTFSDVHLCVHKETNIQYAIKIIDKSLVQMIAAHTDMEIKTEVNILQSSSHPNIIEIIDHFETETYYYIVTELLNGGELLYQLDPSRHNNNDSDDINVNTNTNNNNNNNTNGVEGVKNYTEEHARKIIKQIIQAVSFLHKNNIIHRDLKPENILFKDKSEFSQLKIIDFGLASYYQQGQPLMDVCGTTEFQSPEMLKRTNGYSFSVDMWAIGCILYILLYGHPPFQSKNSMLVMSMILKGEIKFESSDSISDSVKDLIKKLLEPDPEKRLTADEALSHAWINQSIPNSPQLSSSFPKQLRRYNSQRYFKATGDTLLKSQRFGIYSSVSNDNLISLFQKSQSVQNSPISNNTININNNNNLPKRKSIQCILQPPPQ